MKKILIIEDEQILQKTLEDILKEEGYEVINALDGEIGLRLAQTENPDLILLDLIIPKMAGFDVLSNLKQNPKTKEIPVIISTNLGSMENIENALKLGATTYLIKTDYSLKEIVEKVKKALGEN